jgi:hypothetical protein
MYIIAKEVIMLNRTYDLSDQKDCAIFLSHAVAQYLDKVEKGKQTQKQFETLMVSLAFMMNDESRQHLFNAMDACNEDNDDYIAWLACLPDDFSAN